MLECVFVRSRGISFQLRMNPVHFSWVQVTEGSVRMCVFVWGALMSKEGGRCGVRYLNWRQENSRSLESCRKDFFLGLTRTRKVHSCIRAGQRGSWTWFIQSHCRDQLISSSTLLSRKFRRSSQFLEYMHLCLLLYTSFFPFRANMSGLNCLLSPPLVTLTPLSVPLHAALVSLSLPLAHQCVWFIPSPPTFFPVKVEKGYLLFFSPFLLHSKVTVYFVAAQHPMQAALRPFLTLILSLATCVVLQPVQSKRCIHRRGANRWEFHSDEAV